jgi:hypothetical protein
MVFTIAGFVQGILNRERFFVFVFMGLGFELMASYLQSRHSTPLATPPIHFALVTLEMGVSQPIYPCLTSNHHPPDVNLPSTWYYRREPPAPSLLLLNVHRI